MLKKKIQQVGGSEGSLKFKKKIEKNVVIQILKSRRQ